MLDKRVRMMKQDWLVQNKKRRQEQIRSIREGLIKSPQPWTGLGDRDWDAFKDSLSHDWRNTEKPETKKGLEKKALFQKLWKKWIATLLLFALTVIVFQWESPVTDPLKHFTVKVMTQEFQFDQFKAQIENWMGTSPAILPAFFSGEKVKWVPPIQGKLIFPFNEKRKGVILQAKQGEKVLSASEGWVIFVGNKEGLGKVVMVKHAGGTETWYGWLKQTLVREGDWIEAGKPVGQAQDENENQGPYVYFAMRKQGEFINPAGVISFD